jgi:hypothetical protein
MIVGNIKGTTSGERDTADEKGTVRIVNVLRSSIDINSNYKIKLTALLY